MAIMATLFVSGCVKETIQSGVTILTAGIETKTVLQNDEAVLWTNGDKVNVNGVESAALELAEPSTSASFTFNAVLNQPYCAIFPASIYKNAATVTLPATQEYVAGTFAQNASPMAAYTTEGDNLRFQHLCAVLKLTVTKPAESNHNDIAYVEFYGKNGEQVCGDFTIDFETMTLIGASAADADKKLTYNVSSEFVDGALTLYVVVPAAEYSNGYTVKIADAQGHYMEQSKKSAQTLVAGGIYEMPAFDFVPSSTQLDVEISSAAELISFIADYNTGQTPAVAVIKNDFAFSDEENAAFQSINSLTTVIDGNNCTISNFNSGKPLVESALVGSVIKNLTIKGSATVQAIRGSFNFGTFAALLQGEMEYCQSEVNYTVTGAQTEGYIAFGGLVGRLTEGKISNSKSIGNLVFDENFSISSEQTAYVGGLVGRNSNAAGIIESSQVGGAIKFVGTAAYNLYLGGIAGHANGTIKDCEVLSAGENQAVSGTYQGTILLDTDAAKYVCAGGIVGVGSETASIQSSVNKAEMTMNFTRNGDACRTMRVAGISANFSGEIVNVTNEANVYMYSSVKTQYLAGVAATLGATAKVDGCSNLGEILLGDGGDADQGGRENYVGGLFGQNMSAEIKNATNNGAVVIEMIDYDNTNVDTRLYVGGCIGESRAAVTGLANKAAVTWNSTKGWVPTSMFAMGGIVGLAHADVTSVTNSGAVVLNESETKTGQNLAMGGVVGMTAVVESPVKISGSSNTGNVEFNVTGTARAYKNIYVGGVLGYNPAETSVTVSNCNNSGYLKSGLSNRKNGNCKYIGGIVGYLKGLSTVESCKMTGAAYHDDNNNTVTYGSHQACGGIVGVAEGTSEARITIKNCETDTETPVDKFEIGSRRGYAGGIVAYAKYTDISDSKCYSLLSGSFYYSGGICGAMDASTVKNCTVECNASSTQIRHSGGLVGMMDASSSVDGCSVRGNIATSCSDVNPVMGYLVGRAPAGATISNCQYKLSTTYTGSKTAVTGVVGEGEATLTNNTELSE